MNLCFLRGRAAYAAPLELPAERIVNLCFLRGRAAYAAPLIGWAACAVVWRRVWFQVYEHVADRREGGEQPIFDSMT